MDAIDLCEAVSQRFTFYIIVNGEVTFYKNEVELWIIQMLVLFIIWELIMTIILNFILFRSFRRCFKSREFSSGLLYRRVGPLRFWCLSTFIKCHNWYTRKHRRWFSTGAPFIMKVKIILINQFNYILKVRNNTMFPINYFQVISN